MKQQQLDLWLRLAALKKCCDVLIESYVTDAGAEHWRVTITSRCQVGAAPIVVDGENVTQALTQALDRSLAQKWHSETVG